MSEADRQLLHRIVEAWREDVRSCRYAEDINFDRLEELIEEARVLLKGARWIDPGE